MKTEVGRALTIFAALAFVLILVAYWAGSVQVGKTLFSGVNMLGLTFTGRDQQGKFAPYPGNGPSSGSGG